MINRQEADQVLGALAKQFDIEALALDGSGTAVLQFGEDHTLIFEFVEAQNRFTLWSVINDVVDVTTGGNELVLAKHLLTQNFPATSLNGSYFALDSEIGVILLARPVEAHLAMPDSFIKATQDFAEQVIQVANTLGEELAKLAVSDTGGQPDDPYDETTFIKL